MDVLYYIGGGSMHGNRELMYSLRSLEKHCQDIGEVWIVGNRPFFLKNVNYLWIEDKDAFWQNAFNKTLAAIKAGISSDFLLMNDDFYMLSDFKASEYPAYYRGELSKTSTRAYTDILVNTRRILENNHFGTLNYGVHCPMVINGDKYCEIEKYMTSPTSPRCLYGNMFCEGVKTTDCKGDDLIEHETKCFSSKNWAHDIFEGLERLFPTPSKWEKENV